jgi:hypothetical protein
MAALTVGGAGMPVSKSTNACNLRLTSCGVSAING